MKQLSRLNTVCQGSEIASSPLMKRINPSLERMEHATLKEGLLEEVTDVTKTKQSLPPLVEDPLASTLPESVSRVHCSSSPDRLSRKDIEAYRRPLGFSIKA